VWCLDALPISKAIPDFTAQWRKPLLKVPDCRQGCARQLLLLCSTLGSELLLQEIQQLQADFERLHLQDQGHNDPAPGILSFVFPTLIAYVLVGVADDQEVQRGAQEQTPRHQERQEQDDVLILSL
jgi:hypothetical protein